MSTARPTRRPVRGWAATLATALVLVVVAPVGAAVAADPTPAPVTCPSGQTPGTVTQPPSTPTPKTVCVIAPPTPIPAPSVSPEHTVGGPQLAGTGVVVDKPDSVPAPPDGSEVSYVIADMDTGQVLAAKNPHAWLLPASTMKTLTSLVVMPAVSATTKVVATDDEVNADGTRVGMVSGATYTVDDLFHGLVLMSGNDTAYALADAYGGRDKTIAEMNAKAAQLGAWDTVAVDPSGLDAPGQRSSAYDLALFGRAVMQLPAYRQVAATKTYTFPGATDRSGKVFPPFEIQNHNQLLQNYPGTIGVKNGYTTGARNTFIGAATRNGRTLLITQMGEHGHAELDAAGRPAGLGVRQRGAAAAGRDPGGARGRSAARAGRHAGPDHGSDAGPLGDDEGADSGGDDLAVRRWWRPRGPAPAATPVRGCSPRRRRRPREPAHLAGGRRVGLLGVVLGLRRWVRRAGPDG